MDLPVQWAQREAMECGLAADVANTTEACATPGDLRAAWPPAPSGVRARRAQESRASVNKPLGGWLGFPLLRTKARVNKPWPRDDSSAETRKLEAGSRAGRASLLPPPSFHHGGRPGKGGCTESQLQRAPAPRHWGHQHSRCWETGTELCMHPDAEVKIAR